MDKYYWKLEPYKGQNSRFRCPKCNKSRQYTRFINADGEYAPYEYGICNRKDKCGYFNHPKGVKSSAPAFVYKEQTQEFINWDNYNFGLDTDSGLVRLLIKRFGEQKVIETLKKYYVRTDGDFMIFPQVDRYNRLCYAKKMEYKGFNRSKYIYTPFKPNKGKFKQCLFGLHLYNPIYEIGVVEGEKTALYCAMEYPYKIWMATGGEHLIKNIKAIPRATVYPDKGKAFKNWKKKLDRSMYEVDDIMERSSLPEGSDLADFIEQKYIKMSNY
ncbi:DUF6371 domain-containing protein [Aestuariivivens sediminis]|uniref:DUF6371 domain-containing protein n=1 Tax=Aestuariivivens sediminis TaxID=2913557 RepID=UPI001F5AB455|nr:DUF6371 domain-containing protein [Aestuariivivens sediminis]